MQVAVIENNPGVPVGTLGTWLVEARGATLATIPAVALEARRDELFAADLVVSLGAPEAAYDTFPWVLAQRRLLTTLAEENHAVIGICFGGQLLAAALGGDVAPLPPGQGCHGWMENNEVFNPRFAGAWLRWHNDHFTLPPGAELLARSGGINMAFRYRRSVGLQFHPEGCRSGLAAWIARAPEERLHGVNRPALLDTLCHHLDTAAPTRNALYTELLRLTADSSHD